MLFSIKKLDRSKKLERILFYGLLITDILFYFLSDFYPSLDGPAHLYNAGIIRDLIAGNSNTSMYFSFNPFPVPNWTGAFVLTMLQFILPMRIAEKVFLSLYALGMAISFRYFFKSIAPDKQNLPVLIIPFSHSLLFHLGFFNFSISFIFIFLTLAYWIKHRGRQNLKHVFILFVLLSITYFSAVLSLAFVLLGIGLIGLQDFRMSFIMRNPSQFLKELLRVFWPVIIAALPGLILTFLFIQSTSFNNAGVKIPSGTLIQWLTEFKPLVIYDAAESILFRPLALCILFLLLYVLFQRFWGIQIQRTQSGFLLMLALFAMLLYFISPEDAAAGMMNDRYALLFFMFFISWIGVQHFGRWQVLFTMLIAISYGVPAIHRNSERIPPLSAQAAQMHAAASGIEPGSVVLPINFSDNWMHWHFSNYTGPDKSLILLENYEANLGWFPVIWNEKSIPCIQLAGLNSLPGITWKSGRNKAPVKAIDYVLIYGNSDRLNQPEYALLKSTLEDHFYPIEGTGAFVKVYGMKN